MRARTTSSASRVLNGRSSSWRRSCTTETAGESFAWLALRAWPSTIRLPLRRVRERLTPSRIIRFYARHHSMADILSLRGRTALSPFRLAKLRTALTAAHPDHRITGIAATFWHFAEVVRPLTPGERDKLERLLDYGPR